MKSCNTCISCCYGPENYVQVFTDDLAAIGPERAKTLVVPSTLPPQTKVDRVPEPELFMRVVDGHCAALNVTGPNRGCSIYEDRPMLCRALAVGSSSCLEARERRPGPPID
jgi:Fe-S-cluster containining protein